ncbi:serine/threonine-protein kinase [Grosmannia clavigera kw1407]|uniref:non-specific serine/threonine protein kinase n=1 Tax=Grosmannia clavigera (strain kw1407 / UAMH 11150) TaxID=655863 RepID=F0XC54_GROCL|nr:serine/threonine-protein kinase [Grosmannia clavigera kw1407]EFX04248.1 serine/threonine-protein kinase [Grosmannia clavigera kw1407]
MASYGQAMPVARPGQQVALPAGGHHGHSPAPQGTFVPGTKIQVGSHRVVIQKYLSEGGFAHVYLVKMPAPVDGTDLAVLKRVAVPDKDALRGMRTEVETMKRLKGHRAIVTYIDSHASEMHGGGYEVFLLMEFCDGGGLMDFMNTRLQHRLTEPEILGIFSDVAEGLCDFGSAAPPRPAPASVVECRLMDEDVQKHTTLQYRSPEMVDVYRRQPIDEKSDIWALGVLLYKLCYYTTPFEDQSSQLAILNASYRFPPHPVFSERLKSLIASMLLENQQSRPNIYEVLRESCVMQGKDVPIKDIYSGRSHSETRAGQSAIAGAQPAATAVVGAVFAPPTKQQQIIPEVVPMRRGRPTAPAQSGRSSAPRPTPSPRPVTSGDPFAALDANTSKSLPADELSSRFPTLDQFALFHDQGTEFSFDETAISTSKTIPQAALSQATAAIAAGKPPAAGISRTPSNEPAVYQQYSRGSSSPERTEMPPLVPIKPREVSRASAIISSTPELRAISAQKEQMQTQQEEQNQAPTRPEMHRASSVPRKNRPDEGGSRVSPPLKAQLQAQAGDGYHTSSCRPSLEGGRPGLESLEPTVISTQPRSIRPRPVSAYLESNLDYLREMEGSSSNNNNNAGIGGRPLLSPGFPPSKAGDFKPPSSPRLAPGSGAGRDEAVLESTVDYLRAMEDDNKWDKNHHHGKHGNKRASMTALSGTKSMLAGKFGDAFKRFETSTSSSSNAAPARTPSPLKQIDRQDGVGVSGGSGYDAYNESEKTPEDSDDMSPEMRREMERRRLSLEEKRVAAAGAEYRQRLASRGSGPGAAVEGEDRTLPAPPKSIGGVSRAVSIQNRVQSLLIESQTAAQPTRTAQGYGHFTDEVVGDTGGGGASSGERPEMRRKPLVRASTTSSTGATTMEAPRTHVTGSKPAAKPKPQHLNKVLPLMSGNNNSSRVSTLDSTASGRSSMDMARPGSPTTITASKRPINVGLSSSSSSSAATTMPSQLMAMDLPGQPVLEGMSLQDRDDYIQDFQRRFPSLTAIEMVERDLAAEEQSRGR